MGIVRLKENRCFPETECSVLFSFPMGNFQDLIRIISENPLTHLPAGVLIKSGHKRIYFSAQRIKKNTFTKIFREIIISFDFLLA